MYRHFVAHTCVPAILSPSFPVEALKAIELQHVRQEVSEMRERIRQDRYDVKLLLKHLLTALIVVLTVVIPKNTTVSFERVLS